MGGQVGCGILYYRVGDVSEDSLRLCAHYETPLHRIQSFDTRNFLRFLHRLSLSASMNFGILRDRARRETPFAARNNERRRTGSVRCEKWKDLGRECGLIVYGFFFLYCTHNFSDN